MGLSFRKSIKIGKNTRINLSSKGGVGISTGVKGARISSNQQGTKIYGGVGPVRYQKNLNSNIESSSDAYESTEQESEYKERKGALMFIKKYYKKAIIIFFAFIIGGSIGSVGKVSITEVKNVENQIDINAKIIEDKQKELDNLNIKNSELQLYINN